MELETLIQDYFGNRANKRRSTDSVHFELHWERDLVRLLEDFNDRTLVPFIYAFVVGEPRPREVIACLMQMKILQHHFDLAVRPLVEARLTDSTFNNRVGYGIDRAIAKVRDDIRRVSRNYTRDCYIIERDIRAFFPSTDLARSYEGYRSLIEANIPEGKERDDLLFILQRVNFAYPQEHAELRSPRYKWDGLIASGKSVVFNNDPAKGACLGNQYWQVEKNYALADFDRMQVEGGLAYTRYVDDMVWVVENKRAALNWIVTCEKMLREDYGYEMHPRKRYCQHYSKGVRFLGAGIKFGRIYASERALRNCRAALRRWNRRASAMQLSHFLSTANSYLGLLQHRDAYGKIRDLAELVSPAWLRFCHYDDARRCFVANKGYGHIEILTRRYNFTLYRQTHKNKRYGCKNTTSAA